MYFQFLDPKTPHHTRSHLGHCRKLKRCWGFVGGLLKLRVLLIISLIPCSYEVNWEVKGLVTTWVHDRIFLFFRFGSLLACETFHADVHAGNLLVLRDGRVGFIDFGEYRSYSITIQS